MTLIGEFDPADQLLLMQGLEAAAVLISTASLGRKEETASEGFAMANHVLESASEHIAHPLLMSIIQALEDRAAGGGAFPDYGKVVAAPDARDRAMGIVRSAVAAVDAGATEDEASAYRAWLMGIATAVAQAGKEDQGFLGTRRRHGQRRGAGRAGGAGGDARSRGAGRLSRGPWARAAPPALACQFRRCRSSWS